MLCTNKSSAYQGQQQTVLELSVAVANMDSEIAILEQVFSNIYFGLSLHIGPVMTVGIEPSNMQMRSNDLCLFLDNGYRGRGRYKVVHACCDLQVMSIRTRVCGAGSFNMFLLSEDRQTLWTTFPGESEYIEVSASEGEIWIVIWQNHKQVAS